MTVLIECSFFCEKQQLGYNGLQMFIFATGHLRSVNYDSFPPIFLLGSQLSHLWFHIQQYGICHETIFKILYLTKFTVEAISGFILADPHYFTALI